MSEGTLEDQAGTSPGRHRTRTDGLARLGGRAQAKTGRHEGVTASERPGHAGTGGGVMGEGGVGKHVCDVSTRLGQEPDFRGAFDSRPPFDGGVTIQTLAKH